MPFGPNFVPDFPLRAFARAAQRRSAVTNQGQALAFWTDCECPVPRATQSGVDLAVQPALLGALSRNVNAFRDDTFVGALAVGDADFGTGTPGP
jgi:hypothetical protein